MLSDDYEVEYETTGIQTDEPVLLPTETVAHSDQGWCYVILLASFSTLFITNGIHSCFGILYAALISHFNSGYEETAWIGSISLGLLCFFSPVASILIEQIGCRATSAIGGLLCSLGCLLSSFATDIALLYFTHGLLFGLGTSLTYTSSMLVVTRSFHRKRNLATGLCASGSQFGGISLAPLSQVLFDRLGYASTFRTFSGLLLLVAISSLAYKPELVESRNVEDPARKKKSPREMLLVWKNKAYVVWVLATTLVTLGYNIPRYTLVKYAIDQDISKDASAWLISYLCLTSAIGRILYGRICERVPAVYLSQACILACAVITFIVPFLKSYVPLVIVSVISGFPDGGFIASLPAITTMIVGSEKMAEGFGFMLFCQSYSNVIGPPLSGMIFDTSQSYKASFCFAGVPMVLGALALFLIPYYRTSEMGYRQEIDLNCNSGILVTETVSPPAVNQSGQDGEPRHEVIGNYNVIINLPGPVVPVDIRQVNVIIQKPLGGESCIERGNVLAEITSSIGETECENHARQTTTGSNATIVAAEGLLTTRTVNIERQNLVEVESCRINIVNIENACVAEKEGVSFSACNNSAPQVEVPDKLVNQCETPSQPTANVVGCQVITDTIVSVDSIPRCCDNAEQNSEECDVINLLPKSSAVSVKSCTKVQTHGVHQNEDLGTIIQLAERRRLSDLNTLETSSEDEQSETDDGDSTCSSIASYRKDEPLPCTVPLLSPPPPTQGKHHRNTTSEVPTIDLNQPINDPPSLITSSPTGFPLEHFAQDSVSTEVTFEIPATSNPLAFTPEGAMGNTFSLVQDQLPEPLKPTSVCSVWGASPCDIIPEPASGNLDQASATSPLSCELSTVIADVIQSLTSQNTAKSNKEVSGPSNMTATSLSKETSLKSEQGTQVQTPEGDVGDKCGKGEHCGPTRTPLSQASPKSMTQTSVLDTMQSIVAEGCPEDSTLLQDISIDLSLDKDPSVASIVLVNENDDTPQTSSSCVKIPSTVVSEVPYLSVEVATPADTRDQGIVNVFAEPKQQTRSRTHSTGYGDEVPHGVPCEPVEATIPVDIKDQGIVNIFAEPKQQTRSQTHSTNYGGEVPHGVACEPVEATIPAGTLDQGIVNIFAEPRQQTRSRTHSTNYGGEVPHGVPCEPVEATIPADTLDHGIVNIFTEPRQQTRSRTQSTNYGDEVPHGVPFEPVEATIPADTLDQGIVNIFPEPRQQTRSRTQSTNYGGEVPHGVPFEPVEATIPADTIGQEIVNVFAEPRQQTRSRTQSTNYGDEVPHGVPCKPVDATMHEGGPMVNVFPEATTGYGDVVPHEVPCKPIDVTNIFAAPTYQTCLKNSPAGRKEIPAVTHEVPCQPTIPISIHEAGPMSKGIPEPMHQTHTRTHSTSYGVEVQYYDVPSLSVDIATSDNRHEGSPMINVFPEAMHQGRLRSHSTGYGVEVPHAIPCEPVDITIPDIRHERGPIANSIVEPKHKTHSRTNSTSYGEVMREVPCEPVDATIHEDGPMVNVLQEPTHQIRLRTSSTCYGSEVLHEVPCKPVDTTTNQDSLTVNVLTEQIQQTHSRSHSSGQSEVQREVPCKPADTTTDQAGPMVNILTEQNRSRNHSTCQSEVQLDILCMLEDTNIDQGGSMVKSFSQATHQTVKSPADSVALLGSMEPTNPFYDDNIGHVTSDVIPEMATPMESSNPFCSATSLTISIDCASCNASPVESTNPFLQE